MHENDFAESWEYEIGAAWKRRDVKTETEPGTMDKTTHDQLGPRVLPSHGRSQALFAVLDPKSKS